MDIEVESRSGYHVARLSGELTATDGAAMEQELQPLVAARESRLVVDLSGIQSIDSGGLSQLIGLNTRARLSESRVVLCGPTAFVQGVLEVTQLDGWFEIVSDVEAAAARLA